jgi:hypothetical protein
MNKKYLILLHLPVWIVALGLVLAKEISSPRAFVNPLFDSIQLVIVLLWTLGVFYLFYRYFVPRLLQKKRIILFLLLSLLTVCTFPVLSHYVIWLNKVAFGQPHNYSLTFSGLLAGLFVTTIVGGLGTFYRFAVDWFLNIGLREKMENLQLKSEINLLKSKLNPHFLFNTLNNIDTLIETEAKNASAYLGKLSSILRYIVYDSENEKVALVKEINCIKDYVELQKLRLNEKDSIVLNISGNYEGYLVAPVLLLPFVENIFKHGVFISTKNESNINISCNDGLLQFDAENPFEEQDSDHRNNKGIGIETTKKRLDLLYPGLYSLEIEKKENIFRVKLKINLNDS